MRTGAPPSTRTDRRLLALNAALLGVPLGAALALSVAPTTATGLPIGLALGVALTVGIHRALDRLARFGIREERRIGDRTADSAAPATR